MEDQNKDKSIEGDVGPDDATDTVEQEEWKLAHEDYLEIFAGELTAKPKSGKRSSSPERSGEASSSQVADQSVSLQPALDFQEQLTLEGRIEALLFAAPRPLKVADLVDLLQDDEESIPGKEVEAVLQQLVSWYSERSGGFHLEFVKPHGYQFRTVPAASELMERLFSNRPRPLSRAALETLSIIAYRQPATRADIEFIRGVDAGSIIKNLLDRDLIRCVGRKEDAGRPMLFGTTEEFLRVFNLKTLDDLPPLAAFQAEGEMVQEAMKQIDQGDLEVDVEGFIGDEEQPKPQVSEGLELDHAEMTGQESSDRIEGATAANDELAWSDAEASEASGLRRSMEGASAKGESELASVEDQDSVPEAPGSLAASADEELFEIQFEEESKSESGEESKR